MLTLWRNASVRELLTTEAPSFVSSLVIAELFYKFHSFVLELTAFMGTWAALAAVAAWIVRARVSVPRKP